jgi:hypothetical protein
MVEQFLFPALDIISYGSAIFAIVYILKLGRYNANPTLMLTSPLVLYRNLLFLVCLMVTFVAVNVVANRILQDSALLIYGFEVGLAAGSFGIMMMARKLFHQVAHQGRKSSITRLKKEFEEVRNKKTEFQEKNFREENR